MDHSLIPLFDSLTHVTVDGRWFDTRDDASVTRLLAELDSAAPYKACVAAIPGYNMPNSFVLEACAGDPTRLTPIAGLNTNLFSSPKDVCAEVEHLREQGFRAVKIHPTLCNIHLDSPEFDWAMESCAKLKMPVFLCTVFRRRGYVARFPAVDLIYKTFVRHSDVRVLFLHAGLSQLLVFADLVSALPNAMLDCSYTLMKFKGSSLDLDFAYLFEHFDRRCVVGSDFPEYTPAQVRQRMAELGATVASDKLLNVSWRNLTGFLNLE